MATMELANFFNISKFVQFGNLLMSLNLLVCLSLSEGSKNNITEVGERKGKGISSLEHYHLNIFAQTAWSILFWMENENLN